MLAEYEMNGTLEKENVIFIGLICRKADWHVVIFDIGRGNTKEISIADIKDISYSFQKTVKTHDISIYNYQKLLNPTDSAN